MLWNLFLSRCLSEYWIFQNGFPKITCCSLFLSYNCIGLACSQTDSEWFWVMALLEPTAAAGESCDIQGTRAHPRHYHVAPRGARGHHWARWPPLHGLCQSVRRSEENLAHVQNHNLNLCRWGSCTRRWRRRSGMWPWSTRVRAPTLRRGTLENCRVYTGLHK